MFSRLRVIWPKGHQCENPSSDAGAAGSILQGRLFRIACFWVVAVLVALFWVSALVGL